MVEYDTEEAQAAEMQRIEAEVGREQAKLERQIEREQADLQRQLESAGF